MFNHIHTHAPHTHGCRYVNPIQFCHGLAVRSRPDWQGSTYNVSRGPPENPPGENPPRENPPVEIYLFDILPLSKLVILHTCGRSSKKSYPKLIFLGNFWTLFADKIPYKTNKIRATYRNRANDLSNTKRLYMPHKRKAHKNKTFK